MSVHRSLDNQAFPYVQSFHRSSFKPVEAHADDVLVPVEHRFNMLATLTSDIRQVFGVANFARGVNYGLE
jgi:hypothetical protein